MFGCQPVRRLDFLIAGCDEPERLARCRELRALALVFLGPDHPATVALGVAVLSADGIGPALAAIDALPALRRRRLLATFGALMRRPTAMQQLGR